MDWLYVSVASGNVSLFFLCVPFFFFVLVLFLVCVFLVLVVGGGDVTPPFLKTRPLFVFCVLNES